MHNPSKAILHPRAIHPNETNRPARNLPNDTNRPLAICPTETVGAVPACPPERPHSGVSVPKIHTLCAGMNDGCALAGRNGRAHRRRPYQSPLYICAQSSPNDINHPNETRKQNHLHTHRGRKCIAHSRPHNSK